MGKKRGRKPIGGMRIILRLTPEEVAVLDKRRKETGATRTTLIRHALDAAYLGKRRSTDWSDR
jgi:hypothetical protein